MKQIRNEILVKLDNIVYTNLLNHIHNIISEEDSKKIRVEIWSEVSESVSDQVYMPVFLTVIDSIPWNYSTY